MLTFFIYDTAYCKADEDDPKDAVLYFFPTQAYESQCYSLCCQIVGVAKFVRTTFSCPSLINFDKEKFALHWSGKYIFVLGGSTNAEGSILKKQLLFLCGIFCFYHGSINNLLKTCKNNRKEFLYKMELAWSRYITLLQCFNNLLHLPLNAVSLSNFRKYSDSVSKAKQLLHMCQMSASVIAGAVYYNNRVLSSQLSPELTSYLTLMSNENAAFPVNNVNSSNSSLPPNVELKYVYLNQKTIQNILKHNHTHLGSSVRVKTTEKIKVSESHNHCINVTSGSEGDVDSGNCTESIHSRRKTSALSSFMKQTQYTNLNFKSQLLCCSMHATVFKKVVLRCRNKIFKKYLNSEFISEKLKTFEKKACMHSDVKTEGKSFSVKEKKKVNVENRAGHCNLLCRFHADIFSRKFLSQSPSDHSNLSSTSDLEYSCYFCINHRVSPHLTPLSLKNWNSEMQISDYLHHIPGKPEILEYNSTNDKLRKEKNKCKIQILKCRTRSDACSHCTKKLNTYSYHSKNHNNSSALFDSKYRSPKSQALLSSQNMHFGDFWKNMESNDLEKSVLYVQRCGTNMLLLLLNKSYDENILTYLWNCGFTFLKDLDYYAERKAEDINESEAANYIMVYDNIHNIVKERPNYQVSLFEKHVKESVQTIYEDFQVNPKLHMFSLQYNNSKNVQQKQDSIRGLKNLNSSIKSANESVYACQTKQHSAFYLQQDFSSKKSESVCSLSKKATRRLEKYLKINT